MGQSREIVVLRVAPVFQGSMPVLLMRTLEVRSVGAWERAAKIVGKIKKQKKTKYVEQRCENLGLGKPQIHVHKKVQALKTLDETKVDAFQRQFSINAFL